MRVVVLSDAHGNKLYFDKCLVAIEKIHPDKIVFLGDCFGYMREGSFILTSLRKRNAHVLLGNHEAMILKRILYDREKEEAYGLKTDRANIGSNNLDYIESLSPVYSEEIDGKKILYVHGRPDDALNGYLYENDESYHWNNNLYDFIFMGHTHRPYIKNTNNTVYVNVGSCGLPRDIGNAPCFAVFETQMGEVSIHRIWVSESELKSIEAKNIHPAVLECLMRKGSAT